MKKQIFILPLLMVIYFSAQAQQYASRKLDNLTAPTAVNQSLLPKTDNTFSLGSPVISWQDISLKGNVFMDSLRFIYYTGHTSRSTFLGTLAGGQTTGSFNTGIGYNALFANTTGYNNTSLGYQSLTSNTTGYSNTAIGYQALQNNTMPQWNTAIGANALQMNNSENGFAVWNTAVGVNALTNNTEGFENTAIGVFSLYSNTTGQNNTAVGVSAMLYNGTGSENMAIGENAMIFSQGWYNTVSGYNAGLTSGFYNTVNGHDAMSDCNNCSFNTVVGSESLLALTGSYNTAVGSTAGSGDSINNSTFLGYAAQGKPGISNATAIGNSAFVNASNHIIIGNTHITSIGGYNNWSNFSDGRFKKNISENVPGLSFINQLRPITYNLDMDGIEAAQRSGNSNKPTVASIDNIHSSEPARKRAVPGQSAGLEKIKSQYEQIENAAKTAKSKVLYSGFVAQEVEKAAKSLHYDFSGVDAPENKDGFYGLRYGDFIVPLVKAVQELSKKNDSLEERVKALEAMIMNHTLTSSNISASSIEQNAPNPFSANTVIRYHIPLSSGPAKVLLTDEKGALIKTYDLTDKSSGQLVLDGTALAAGTYQYSLWINNVHIDTRQMVITH